jgi:hypothetical protein
MNLKSLGTVQLQKSQDLSTPVETSLYCAIVRYACAMIRTLSLLRRRGMTGSSCWQPTSTVESSKKKK